MPDSDDLSVGTQQDRGGIDRTTNMRGETPLQAFNTAVVEAFAPLLREAIRGREITEADAKNRLEHQLNNRGFNVDSEDNRD